MRRRPDRGAEHSPGNSRRFDEALPRLLLATQDDPSFPTPYRYLAACYAHMGQLDEAREVVARLRSITPAVVAGATPFRNPDHREWFLSGLRLAACASGPRCRSWPSARLASNRCRTTSSGSRRSPGS
jgi:hypothetical protein